jgi:hypothetical protein
LAKLQDPREKEFRADFNLALKNLKLSESDEPAEFTPASSVGTHNFCGQEGYYEVGFPSEGEVIKYTGLAPKALGLKVTTRPLEDGPGVVSGSYISLRDLDIPLGDILAMRKVKVYRGFETEHNEQILSRARQIRQQQGSDMYTYVTEQTTAAQGDATKTSSRAHLPTLENLRKKAADIISQRQMGEQQQQQMQDDEAADEDDENEETATRMAKKSGGIALGSIAAKTYPKSKAAGKKTKRKAKSPSPDPSMRSGGGKGGAGGGYYTLDEGLAKTDPELHKVAIRLGHTPVSFHRLSVRANLEGQKLGVSIDGAQGSTFQMLCW